MHPTLRKSVLALSFVLATNVSQAQIMNLVTTYAAGNGLYGAMFDLAATGGVPLRVKDFAINTGVAAIWQVYVVTAGTTWIGNEFTPGAWTLVGTTGSLTPAGVGSPTVLGLNLNVQLPGNGQKVGFYVTATTSSTLQYTNGTVQGALYASNSLISFYEGRGLAIPQFSGGFTPRIFNGTIFYQIDQNILSMSQSGPGIGDLTIGVSNLSPTGAEGYMLLSANTAAPVGSGAILGLNPDPGTFSVFSFPYFPGNPLHFNALDVGVFPQAPFVVGPGAVSSLTGLTLDATLLILSPFSFYDSRSNVVRITFQ